MKRPTSIAIIGLGQIGGSLALALRKARPTLQITGIDTSRKRLKLLRWTLSAAATKWEAADSAGIIVVCLHFQQTLEYLRRAPRGPLILDVCSGKRRIVDFANRKRLRFIGGHPMAGNERPAEKGWDANLFRGAPFFICPSRSATSADLTEAKKLIRLLHARPLRVDPSEHDRAVAITSHLPALLSDLYRRLAEDVPSVFQGPGYHSFVRLSRTPSALLKTFFDSNSRCILESLRRFKAELETI